MPTIKEITQQKEAMDMKLESNNTREIRSFLEHTFEIFGFQHFRNQDLFEKLSCTNHVGMAMFNLKMWAATLTMPTNGEESDCGVVIESNKVSLSTPSFVLILKTTKQETLDVSFS